MTIQPWAIYLTDNGRALCGEHLGMTARCTGRDISGQSIYEVTPDDVREMDDAGVEVVLACETCGRKPSRVWPGAVVPEAYDREPDEDALIARMAGR